MKTTPSIVIGLVLGLLCVPALSSGAAPAAVTGSISGMVLDSTGVPQMGASVLLFDRFDRLLARALTDEAGSFQFSGLLPDRYTIRVSLASFFPALKEGILVQAGLKSLLSINLANVFSSIELIYPSPGERALMSQDWKWALRGSSGTRPVLRIVPRVRVDAPQAVGRSGEGVFSETRGMVQVAGGEGALAHAYGSEPDLGTAFALATSLYRSNQLQFSGNFGYSSNSGTPVAGFRTSYSRDLGGIMTPEVAVTVRQSFVPLRAGLAWATGEGSSPTLRTMSLSFSDRVAITEAMLLEYGAGLESVTFVERLNYVSPYARLTYDLGSIGQVSASYSSGLPPSDLVVGTGDRLELQQDLAAVSIFPRVSLRGGSAEVQRASSYEIGYRNTRGRFTYGGSVYRETVSNAGLRMLAPEGGLSASPDVLPDLFSNGFVYNAGAYQSLGYAGAVSRRFMEELNVALSLGSGDVLATADASGLETLGDLRSSFRTSRHHWAGARLFGAVPKSGTAYSASYAWTDPGAISPFHYYFAPDLRADPGLNFLVRQPIPSGSLPGRLELSGEMRNLLSQGYVPVTLPNGRRVFFATAPRVVRGGVALVF